MSSEYQKLYRSRNDQIISGVCGGLAEYFNKDPVLIRLLWIIITIFTVGIGILAYILFWLVVEKYPDYYTIPPRSYTTNRAGIDAKTVHHHYHYRG